MLDIGNGEEVPRDVQHHAAPWKARDVATLPAAADPGVCTIGSA